MRCLENHDQPRIASRVSDERALRNFTAMLYFLKGSTLIYAGQEYRNTHLPSLFEKEPIERDAGKDISPFLKKLGEIKKNVLSCRDYFQAAADDENDIAILTRDDGKKTKIGIFSLAGKCAEVDIKIENKNYVNQMDNKPVTFKDGKLLCTGEPILFTL